ncbi:S-adenosyl-L-methionine-dependent methyltransferase [Xylariaceae sp. FL1019]|nr:S-adenosyl-L-methionine-dependent methyltransferase [Xylariaceae sp. FL1019]
MASEKIELLNSIKPEDFSPDERYAAKEAARKLLARLETPFELFWHLEFALPPLHTGLQLGLDLGLWSKWAELDKQTPNAPKTLDDLVGMCTKKIEPNLLRRFIRHIAVCHVLEEVDVDTWKPTPHSIALGDTSTNANHLVTFGVNLSKFLGEIDYQEPLDLKKFDNHRNLRGQDFFEYCQANPQAGSSFIGMMTAIRDYKMDWTAVYDTQRITQGADLSKPLFVDIGGAHGLDGQRLLDHNPDLGKSDSASTAKLILQDLPDVITTHAHEKLDPRIERMPHDFFTPQPVQGARAYFFHAVPHDWPDAECLKIFGEVRKAMKPGYSKLLIYGQYRNMPLPVEMVIPTREAMPIQTTLDVQLMVNLSGMERTEDHWKRLLKEAGLKVNDISRHARACESVIEAVRDDE